MQKAKILSRGRVTIPKEIRDLFCLKPGNKIIFIENGCEVLIRKANKNKSSMFGADKRLKRYGKEDRMCDRLS